MTLLTRWTGVALALVFCGGVASPAWSQPRPDGARPYGVNAQNAANQNRINPATYPPAAGNLRQAAPATGFGTAPPQGSPYGTGFGAAPPPGSPYGPGFNPNVTTATINPTYVTGGSQAPSYAPYGYPGYGYAGYDLNSPGAGYLRGAADLTAATGQYWKDIQSASLSREYTRQESLVTKRKQMELELEYERNRPTATTMRNAERATDLNWARRDPPATEIWAGRSLNVLYQSIVGSPRAVSGPTIPLDEQVLRGINLTTKTTRGSTGLLKDGGKLTWPLPLQEPAFDEIRDRLSKNVESATVNLERYNKPPDRAMRQALNDDLVSLSALLDGQVKDLPPSDYIGSRRFLNQLKDTFKAMSDPTLLRSAAGRVPDSVRSVSQLVSYMAKNGLEFAPAVAPGDETAYTALYYSLRSYEAGVAVASR